MEVTDEMVEAACRGYWPAHWPHHMADSDITSIREHMRAALTAALAVAPKPRVKALEWRKGTHGNLLAKPTYWAAGYTIIRTDLRVSWQNDAEMEWYDVSSVEDAQAAAQANYERRVLSALEDQS